jgi:glutathione synthase/RimK-type ligase-like ATP-grasp enzyme
MSVYIYCGNPKSEGGKRLAEALGVKRLRHTGSTYVPKQGDVVINWGAVKLPSFHPATVVNEDVSVSSNKLSFFKAMPEGITPAWSVSKAGPLWWIEQQGRKAVCRTVLNGSGGKGIVIAKTASEIVDAPLYVEYVNKKDEYRVHVMKGKVIDLQKKARKLSVENPNWEVRNLAGGFIYKRHDISPPKQVLDVALECMKHLPLTFGAVDVIWNAEQERAYVLEVNSAPGLEGQTVTNYANAFKSMLGNTVSI